MAFDLIFSLLISFAILLLTTFVQAFYHKGSGVPTAELKRRVKKGDEQAKQLLAWDEYLPALRTIRFLLYSIIVIFGVWLNIQLYGTFTGCVMMLATILSAHILTQVSLVERITMALLFRYEKYILSAVKKTAPFIAPIYGEFSRLHNVQIHSAEDLEDVVQQSDKALSKNQREMILASLTFDKKTVADVMTPRKQIKSIDKKELLGPLVLDDLHKINYLCLPVTNASLDKIVGLLRTDVLLSTDTKHSVTVAEAMQYPAYFLHSETTLHQALAAFLQTAAPLFIVLDDKKKTVGIVTLSDVLQSLTGESSEAVLQYENAQAIVEYTQSKRDIQNTN